MANKTRLEAGMPAKYSCLRYTDGLPAVADFIASDPDHETFIFRRFDKLAARHILQLQSELVELEHLQEALDRDAAQSDDHELHSSLRDWARLKENAKQRGEEKKRTEIAYRIDVSLERYCKRQRITNLCVLLTET
jgi:hypothetical protein